MKTAFAVLLIAFLATAGLAGLYLHPWVLFAALFVLNAVVIGCWHERQDLVRWMIGATVGNLIELVCDLSGVWIHISRQALDVAPFYIFLCYPLLAIAFPRLLAVFDNDLESKDGMAVAAILLGCHAGLSALLAQSNKGELAVSTIFLTFALIRFHRRRDFLAAIVGMSLGLFWEIPCTYWGAWRFPRPQLVGLLPYWLPFAYGVFFIGLNRLSAGVVAAAESSKMMIRLGARLNGLRGRRPDHDVVALLERR